MKFSKISLTLITFFFIFCFFSGTVVYAKSYQFGNERSERDSETDVSVYHASGEKSVVVDFNINKMVTKKSVEKNPVSDAFKELEFSQLKLSNLAGDPALPYYSVIVEGRAENIKVSYQTEKKKTIMNLIPVPAQAEKLRCLDCPQPSFKINWKRYETSEKKFYEVQSLGDIRGVELTRVTLYPAQYNAEDRSLEIYPEIDFTISSGEENTLFYTDDMEKIYERVELNNRYLILSPSEYIPALADFIDWKIKGGYDVSVVSLESIGNNFLAVKNYLKARYNNPETNFSYALLVGHENNFPTEYVKTGSSSQTPSDLHYFTMGDSSDFLPDVLYGRLVVGSINDIKNQIKKSIAYESDSLANREGWRQHIGLASDEGSDPSDEEYLAQMTTPFVDNFKVDSRTFLQKNSDSTPTNLNATLSSGAMWLNYIGHGSGTSWPSMRTTYGSSQIKNLEAGSVKPVIIDVACQNGRFKYNAKQLGERFMNEEKNGEPIGAVAYYGGSVNISWNPPAIMAVGINKLVVDEKIDELGKALLAGQLYLFNHYTDLGAVKENLAWYHLFGDPSLKLHIGQ